MARFQGFWGPREAKMAQKGLQMGERHLFAHPKWSKFVSPNPKTKNRPYLELRASNPKSEGT